MVKTQLIDCELSHNPSFDNSTLPCYIIHNPALPSTWLPLGAMATRPPSIETPTPQPGHFQPTSRDHNADGYVYLARPDSKKTTHVQQTYGQIRAAANQA